LVEVHHGWLCGSGAADYNRQQCGTEESHV
jgi:hypothetical protein